MAGLFWLFFFLVVALWTLHQRKPHAMDLPDPPAMKLLPKTQVF